MIIQIEAPDRVGAENARSGLRDLTAAWGHEITDAPGGTPAARTGDKSIDPVAIASLAVSLPSAALAVADLADRIRKRRRAAALIDHAQQLADSRVAITVITLGRVISISTLTPDQLLDLQAEQEDSAS